MADNELEIECTWEPDLTDEEACAMILAQDPFQNAGAPCWKEPDNQGIVNDIRSRGKAAREEFLAKIDSALKCLTKNRKLPSLKMECFNGYQYRE